MSKITGFHQDEPGDWVAELDCGHTQHVRHNPPWINRPWVVTPEGRAGKIGATLRCKLCDVPPQSTELPSRSSESADF